MPHDDYADMFRFPLGQCVRWAEQPQTQLYICQRRWTQREILDPVVTYRVRTTQTPKDYHFPSVEWIHEHDLIAWVDDERAAS